MKHRIRLYRLFMVGFALLLSTPRLVLCQDYLTEEQVALTFGDLNRPAEVLLGEAEARLARANLAMLLQEYSHGQAVLGELRRKSRFGLLDPEAIATDEISTSSKRHEQFLKQTETRIHEVC